MPRVPARRLVRRLSLEQLERREVLSVTFVDTGQDLESSRRITLGDLDDDGDLDIFALTNDDLANKVWLNVGTGRFLDSGQYLGESGSIAAALGDLDGDGDLDAFVGNATKFILSDDVEVGIDDASRVWLNDGHAHFIDSGQIISDSDRRRNDGMEEVILGDYDGDADLDALVLNGIIFGEPTLWANDGDGAFSYSGDIASRENRRHADGILSGDVDNDGDLDILTNVHTPLAYRVWLNDGVGSFAENSQPVVAEHGSFLNGALGDVDGDDDIDIVVVCGCEIESTDRIWLNDGLGNFTDSGQDLGDGLAEELVLGDLDNDGDLDAMVFDREGIATIRLNNGQGIFQESAWYTALDEVILHASLADVDRDGDLDAIVGTSEGTRVLLNQSLPNPQPGDANRDGEFNQLDIVQVLQSAKYLTGDTANWEQGDWYMNGVFDQFDLIAALQTGNYLQGPYAAR